MAFAALSGPGLGYDRRLAAGPIGRLAVDGRAMLRPRRVGGRPDPDKSTATGDGGRGAGPRPELGALSGRPGTSGVVLERHAAAGAAHEISAGSLRLGGGASPRAGPCAAARRLGGAARGAAGGIALVAPVGVVRAAAVASGCGVRLR